MLVENKGFPSKTQYRITCQIWNFSSWLASSPLSRNTTSSAAGLERSPPRNEKMAPPLRYVQAYMEAGSATSLGQSGTVVTH